MSDEEKKVFQEIKNITLTCYDTLEVIGAAIEGDSLVSSTLLGPIDLLKKELMDNIVVKVDHFLGI